MKTLKVQIFPPPTINVSKKNKIKILKKTPKKKKDLKKKTKVKIEFKFYRARLEDQEISFYL